MSKCQFTTLISETECIGDSLAKINHNFFKLDKGLCDTPNLIPGDGLSVEFSLPMENSEAHLETTNSYSYLNSFDHKAFITEENAPLSDGTTIKVNKIQYKSAPFTEKPQGTFTLLSPNNKPPKVTLFWSGSGKNDLSIYSLNNNLNGYNGSINTLTKSGNLLYVGGSFSKANTYTNRKLALLSSDGGLNNSEITLNNPLSTQNEGDILNQDGAIYKIIRTQVGSSGSSFRGLIVAGTFSSLLKGQGLTIVNLDNNNATIPFFVHGKVYSAIVVGEPNSITDKSLYIVGDFDYICPGIADIEGARIYTKSIAKINLEDVSGPSCIDINFAQRMTSTFDGAPVIYTIDQTTRADGVSLFLGGKFKIFVGDTVVAQNIVAMDSFGEKRQYWNPIISGPVYAIKADTDNGTVVSGYTNLYVGGNFNQCGESGNPIFQKRNNAVAYYVYDNQQVSQSTTWNPVFNRPVTSFAVDSEQNGYVYCYGSFTLVNGRDVTYLVAIRKDIFGAADAGTFNEMWRPKIQNAPDLINSGIIADTNSRTVTIAGNFESVNSERRIKLAQIRSAYELNVLPSTIPKVNWEVGLNTLGAGRSMSFDVFTPTVSSFSYTEPVDRITTTTLPPITSQTKGFEKGQPYRFYIRRLCENDTLLQPVNLIGWSVDFN